MAIIKPRTSDRFGHLYIAFIGVLAAAFLVLAFLVAPPDVDRSILITALVLIAISLIFELGINFSLLITGSTSFSTVSYMAMIFLLPFPLPALAALAVFVSDLRERKPWDKVVFNSVNYVLTFGLTSLTWHLYYGSKPFQDIPFSFQALAVIVAVVIAFYSINVFLLNGYLTIANRRSFSYVWITQDFDFLLPYLSLQVVGVLVALVWNTSPIIIPLLIVPAFTTYLAFETIQRLQRQTQDAMIAMADAIDARDPYTAKHSLRVTELSVQIAEAYGLAPREVDRIELAARVHDLGKIGISDTILNKPGKLDEDEWALMCDHPVIGEQLLSSYRQFQHEAEIVRFHHERWDGKGYPDKIHGHTIPIGARIIGVADTFDAMTSDRPYRKALSNEIAVHEIRQQALLQFDPKVVASFLQVMENRNKLRSIPIATDVVDEKTWYSSLP